MFQKGDKNITGNVKIDGKADRLEDVLDPFRCTPLVSPRISEALVIMYMPAAVASPWVRRRSLKR